MVIRAFGTEEFEKDRYNTANINLAKNQLVVNRVIVVLMPAMMLVMNLTNLFIVWLGSYQVANSALQIGDMMAFMQYAMQIILAFLMISMMFILIPRAAVSAARIREVLETESVIQDPEQPKPFDPAQTGVVEFRTSASATTGRMKISFSIFPLPPSPGRRPPLSALRLGQIHAYQPHPPLLRRDQRGNHRQRRQCQRRTAA